MASNDARIAVWLNHVVDLLGEPLTAMPVENILQHVMDTWPIAGAATYWASADGSFGMTFVPEGALSNEQDTFDMWLSGEFFDCHALMTWYAVTGDLRPQTAGRVPSALVPAHRRDILERPLARLGIEQQLGITYRRDATSEHSLVLGRGRRDFSDDDLVLAEAIQRGMRCLDQQISVLRRVRSAGMTALDVGLTPREAAVLQLIADGVSVRMVGRQLGCSPRTVEKHLQHSYRKLGVRDRLNAVRLVLDHGLLAMPEMPLPPTAVHLANYRGPLAQSA